MIIYYYYYLDFGLNILFFYRALHSFINQSGCHQSFKYRTNCYIGVYLVKVERVNTVLKLQINYFIRYVENIFCN